MRRIIAFFRSLVLSLEFVIVLVFVYVRLYHPDIMGRIDSAFSKESNKLEWLALIPCGALVWTLNVVRKIRFPECDKRLLLQKWEDYDGLCVVCYVAVFYAVLFACSAVISWISIGCVDDSTKGLLLIASVVGSLIVALSCYLAEMAVNDEFAKIDDKSPEQ